MHSVHLGVCQWLNASCIYELIKYNYLSQGQDAKLYDHLHVFTRRLNSWCSLNRIRQLIGQTKNLESPMQCIVDICFMVWGQALSATHPNSATHCGSWRIP